MRVMAPQITSLMIIYSTIYSGEDHKGPVMRKMFPFDDVIMWQIERATGSLPKQWPLSDMSYLIHYNR